MNSTKAALTSHCQLPTCWQTAPELAFTVEELILLLLDTAAREVAPDEVQEVLELLAAGGQVQAKEIGGRWWYTYRTTEERQLGFLREQR